MKRKLENVHVELYGKKQLRQAMSRLNNLGFDICPDIFNDFECHSNDILIYHDNKFKVVQALPVTPSEEITLNDLVELAGDYNDKPKELEVGKWYWLNTKGVHGSSNKELQNALMYYNGESNSYVFNFLGEFYDNFNGKYQDTLANLEREATHQEVKSALIKEAKILGFNIGIKINQSKLSPHYTTKDILISTHESFTFISNDNSLWLGGCCIFKNGKWAEVIKEPKVKIGDYVFTALKNAPVPGFTVYQLHLENSLEILNAPDGLYNVKVITKEKFEQIRKEFE